MSSTHSSSDNQRSETIFEQSAWIVFLGLSLIIVVFGLGDFVTGGSTFQTGEAPTMERVTGMTWQDLMTSSPEAANLIDYLVRAEGAGLFAVGLFSTFVSLTAFRQGARWAWFAMWIWPLWVGLGIPVTLNAYKQPSGAIPPPLISGPIFIGLSVLTLGLSYRKYFQKR